MSQEGDTENGYLGRKRRRRSQRCHRAGHTDRTGRCRTSDCTLYPSGVTPSAPAASTPPLGTRPPAGLTPAVPGNVVPPVATLPPPGGGLPPYLAASRRRSQRCHRAEPHRPYRAASHPPIATLPSRWSDTIRTRRRYASSGTRPPAGLTPAVPGNVTPRLRLLPPPGGVTPAVPGGVAPPIATLPPEGATPAVPGRVVPPIGSVRPDLTTPGLPQAPPVAAVRPASQHLADGKAATGPRQGARRIALIRATQHCPAIPACPIVNIRATGEAIASRRSTSPAVTLPACRFPIGT